jgi:hypothetical protein
MEQVMRDKVDRVTAATPIPGFRQEMRECLHEKNQSSRTLSAWPDEYFGRREPLAP